MPTFSMPSTCCQMWAIFSSDRKSTRLNSSHLVISYAVFCLKKHVMAELGGLLPYATPARLRQRSTPRDAGRADGRRQHPGGLWDTTARRAIGSIFFFNDTATTEIYTLSHTTLFQS